MICDRIREQIPECLAGRLDAAAREKVIDHVDGCSKCRAEMAELGVVWRGFESMSEPEPSPEVRVRFLETLQRLTVTAVLQQPDPFDQLRLGGALGLDRRRGCRRGLCGRQNHQDPRRPSQQGGGSSRDRQCHRGQSPAGGPRARGAAPVRGVGSRARRRAPSPARAPIAARAASRRL